MGEFICLSVMVVSVGLLVVCLQTHHTATIPTLYCLNERTSADARIWRGIIWAVGCALPTLAFLDLRRIPALLLNVFVVGRCHIAARFARGYYLFSNTEYIDLLLQRFVRRDRYVIRALLRRF